MCAIVLFFGATCAITLVIDSFFVCQKYAVTLLELSLFETGKESSWRDCTSDCRFVCSGICRLSCCIYFLLMMLLSWSTTLNYSFRDCWTCVREGSYLPHSTIQFFSPCSSLSCTPNVFWSWGHLFCCNRIAYPYFRWQWRRCVLQLPSRDGGGSARKDGLGISSWSFPFDDLRTWPQSPLDGCLSTACIVLSSLLTMTSMTKKRFEKASSTIFRIAEASILFEIPSKFFGHSCSDLVHVM